MVLLMGPASRASRSAGLEKAMMLKNVPSVCRSTTRASSPHSGWPGNVPQAKPSLSGSSMTRTIRHGATICAGPSDMTARIVAPTETGWSCGKMRDACPLASYLVPVAPQRPDHKPASRRSGGDNGHGGIQAAGRRCRRWHHPGGTTGRSGPPNPGACLARRASGGEGRAPRLPITCPGHPPLARASTRFGAQSSPRDAPRGLTALAS